MLSWEHSGFSIDASVRISLFRPQRRVYFQPLEHLVRYCAWPTFALERLSVIGGRDGSVERIRSTLPGYKRGQWIGPGRQKKATAADSQGVVHLTPHDIFLADLVARSGSSRSSPT